MAGLVVQRDSLHSSDPLVLKGPLHLSAYVRQLQYFLLCDSHGVKIGGRRTSFFALIHTAFGGAKGHAVRPRGKKSSKNLQPRRHKVVYSIIPRGGQSQTALGASSNHLLGGPGGTPLRDTS